MVVYSKKGELMKKIVGLFVLLLSLISLQSIAGTDWCSGETCKNPGYWYDVEERCTDEYRCEKYCLARTGAGAVEETCSQGSKNCKCRKPFNTTTCDQKYWSNCGGTWRSMGKDTVNWAATYYPNTSFEGVCGLQGVQGTCGSPSRVVDAVPSQGELNCKCK